MGSEQVQPDQAAVAVDSAFSVGVANLVVGPGATSELGDHARDLGLKRVLLFSDPRVVDSGAAINALESLRSAGIETDLFVDVAIEPTDRSFVLAAEAASAATYDGFVAVGGGSVMDTAKAANLYSTYPNDFLAYVNPPIGNGVPPPGPLRPLIAIPTTAGTGSETTGVAIFDLESIHAKTGISHRLLRPWLAIIDPLNTLSLPPMVTASSAFDILCHALEAYTARPYSTRPRPDTPSARPAYQGANPFSDIWAERTLSMLPGALRRVIANPSDVAARTDLALAATWAGIGFGNAGVHLPHGMSYAVSGGVKEYIAPDYPRTRPLVPHGMSVILNAPSVFRHTAAASPERHLRAAELLGASVDGVPAREAGELVAARVIELMRLARIPNGLADVGYEEQDIPALVEGTLPQHRVTKLAPVEVDGKLLTALFRGAMRYW